MAEQEKPQELCYAVEFDDYGSEQPGRVEVSQQGYGLAVHLRTSHGGTVELLSSDRDQFGVFLMWGNRVTAAQEDDTRSCIDAVILALQFVQRQCEITKPPTVVVDTTEQPQEPQGPAEQKAVAAEREDNNDFSRLMSERAIRDILKEEDRKAMEWVNSQPVVDAVAPAAARPTLDTVWNEIQRLISVNARHRRGFTMQECDAVKTLDRAEDEFEELVYANAAAKPMELGDTVSVLLYYAHCLGLTQHDLAELMLEKFKLRFTEG